MRPLPWQRFAALGALALAGCTGAADGFGTGALLSLDYFGDTVESIRSFDPVTQRSSTALEEVRIQPLSLFPSGGEVPSLVLEIERRFPRLAAGRSGVGPPENGSTSDDH